MHFGQFFAPGTHGVSDSEAFVATPAYKMTPIAIAAAERVIFLTILFGNNVLFCMTFGV